MPVSVTGVEGLAKERLHFDSRQLKIPTCEKAMLRRNVVHHVTRNLQRAGIPGSQEIVKMDIKLQQIIMTVIKTQVMWIRWHTKEIPRMPPNCGAIVSVMDHHNMTITWTYSPADVPKEVEDQVDFLLNLSKEEEYVKLVELAADVNVSLTLLSNCDII
jgi:hypothetical protein